MLVFDSSSHTYRHPQTKKEYVSVTTLLSKYKKPFNAVAISERIAKRDGIAPEEVRAKWTEINEESKKYGTLIHSIIEQYNIDKIVPEDCVDLIKEYNSLGIITDNDHLLIEEQVYSHSDYLAGTADIIRLEEKGGYSIFDIKTNKKFNLYNQYSENMLYPVDHLSVCELNTYSLQLSFYAYMYEIMSGRKLNQLGVFYYNKNNNTFKHIPIPYMKTDVLNILRHYNS